MPERMMMSMLTGLVLLLMAVSREHGSYPSASVRRSLFLECWSECWFLGTSMCSQIRISSTKNLMFIPDTTIGFQT